MVTDFESIKARLKYCSDELKKLNINLLYTINDNEVIMKLCVSKVDNTPFKNFEMHLAFSNDVFGRYSKDEILNYIYQFFISEVEEIKSFSNEVNND